MPSMVCRLGRDGDRVLFDVGGQLRGSIVGVA
jgi:hypothetical protein